MTSPRRPPCVVAIVPAAGQGRRFGGPKQLAPVAGRPMLLDVLDALSAAGVDSITVVTTPAIAAALDLPGRPGVLLAYNENADSEMIDSIRIGLAAAQPVAPHIDGFLICPADHPGLSTADLAACLDAFRGRPDRITIAARDGRRGHPLIFPAALLAFVNSPACDGGLNALPHAMADRVVLVPCQSIGVTRDIDTPADLDPPMSPGGS